MTSFDSTFTSDNNNNNNNSLRKKIVVGGALAKKGWFPALTLLLVALVVLVSIGGRSHRKFEVARGSPQYLRMKEKGELMLTSSLSPVGPLGCTRELDPVICGGDGDTFNNPCLAEKAGYNVETQCFHGR